MLKPIALSLSLFVSSIVMAHHYKGLPHYSYFENYPQVPTLEFVGVHNGYEIFVTVYNFQGLDLKVVEDPDVVRLYAFIYNIKTERIYKGQARFEIYSDGEIKHQTEWEGPEQENIFVVQKNLKTQDNLQLISYVKDESGEIVEIKLPFQVTKSIFQKYGLLFAIVAFFMIVALIKLITTQREKVNSSESKN